MRAILTSFGSVGDIQPFIALADQLRRHGHQVALALPPTFAPLVLRRHFEFIPIGPQNEAFRQIIEAEVNGGGVTNTQLADFLSPQMMMQMFHDLCQACAGADVMICGTQHSLGPIVHAVTRVPYIAVQLDCFNEVDEDPRFIELEQQVAPMVNGFRAHLGLPAVNKPLGADGRSDLLSLFATSKLIVDPSKEQFWPDHYHVTGYFFLDEPEWQPDEALVSFLADGPPPVYISFGSMVHGDPREMTTLLLRAIKHVGCRAILHGGWSGLADSAPLPESIHTITFAPYGWLLPRVAAVVHHGGAGTTSWALRCGTPSVFVPHLWNQSSLAQVAQKLGCAGDVIPHTELTAERLTQAISEAIHNPRIRAAAAEVSSKLAAEHGVETAARLIEQTMTTQVSKPVPQRPRLPFKGR